jgi:hypothetical protein
MREQFAGAFVIGLLVVAVAVGGILLMQRGAHMELTGSMAVRILPTDPNTALAVINMRISNPSAYDFEVSDVTVTLETAAGEFPTTTVGRVDAKRLFDSMPEAGPFHPTLYTKAVIPAHSSAGDYTLLAQYSAPEKILNDRKRFLVRIREINGKVAEFSEK